MPFGFFFLGFFLLVFGFFLAFFGLVLGLFLLSMLGNRLIGKVDVEFRRWDRFRNLMI